MTENREPRTEERSALSELFEKAGDGDFLRTVAEAVLHSHVIDRSHLAHAGGNTGFPYG